MALAVCTPEHTTWAPSAPTSKDGASPDTVSSAPLTASVYLFKEGKLLGQYKSRVMLQREGMERFIHEVALNKSFFYGLLTVVMAAGAAMPIAIGGRNN